MTQREKVDKAIDESFGMFLEEKDNPIYKNLKSKLGDQIISLVIKDLESMKKIIVIDYNTNKSVKEMVLGGRYYASQENVIFNKCLNEVLAKWEK